MITIRSLRKEKARLGLLFLAPIMSGILIFTAGPILFSLLLSFFYWDIFKPMKFAGLANYQWLFEDEVAGAAFKNTILFAVATVVTQNILGFTLALSVRNILNKYFRFFFRSVFFLPLLMSGATISVFMAYMFNTDFGVVNYYLSLIGISQIAWLTSTQVALITTVIIYVWQHIGFAFILFLGAFSTMPQEVLDAAKVDGAKGLKKIWHIYLPLVSPTLFFASVIGFIHAVQVFDQPYILTRGGPGDSNRTAVMLIYDVAFQDLEFGYGSAIAFALFLIIFAATLIQFWAQKKWVFYE
jgi:multiple sugar transport system permease protein|tara:strand:- start:396 stop:1289 length:894 start_codon:yes stop_codon:yes gene_type:complete